jgi:hypothetical protein
MIKTAFKRAALAAALKFAAVPAQPEPLKNLGWSRLWSRSRKNAQQSFKIGDYYILLPPEHKLPEYQAKGRLYDRFLPTLCLALPQDGETIIDLGANVGDTAIAIVQRCDNPI